MQMFKVCGSYEVTSSVWCVVRCVDKIRLLSGIVENMSISRDVTSNHQNEMGHHPSNFFDKPEKTPGQSESAEKGKARLKIICPLRAVANA